MSAIWTALLESETKASLVRMVCKLREALEQAAVHLEMAAADLDKAGRPASAISARIDAKEARAALKETP